MQAINYPKTTSQLREISDGKRGILETLKLMRGLVGKGKNDLIVRTKAAELVKDLPPKAYSSEGERLHAWVRDNIRYIRDINGTETLHDAVQVMKFGQGDCDDKSILVASMLESIGHPTRFVAMGLNGGDFSHVYVETKLGTKWVGVETTENVPFGWHPNNMTSRMVIYN